MAPRSESSQFSEPRSVLHERPGSATAFRETVLEPACCCRMSGFRRWRRLIKCAARENVIWSSEPAVSNQQSALDRQFEAFFIEHYPALVRTLRRLLGDAGQAEEVAADAFCRLPP